jgi:flagellar motor switch protein FliG
MTGDEKAALLLKSLTPEVTESVLSGLEAGTGNRLRAQLRRFEQAPPPSDDVNRVLSEFYQLLDAIDAQLAGRPTGEVAEAGGTEPVAARPARKYKPKGQNLLPPVEVDQSADAVAQLMGVPVERLAPALEDEQPRTIAVILNAMDPEQAGDVLKRLPAALRREASVLLGAPAAIPPAVLQRIAEAVFRKSLSIQQKPADKSDAARFKKTADMLRLLPKPERLEIMNALAERDPTTSDGVRDFLYQFQDMLLIEDRSMQKLLSEVDSKSLAAAIKTAPQNILDKVLNNLSKRARETLTEEMEFLGTITPEQAQQAQKTIVEVIQRLDQAGELVMQER